MPFDFGSFDFGSLGDLSFGDIDFGFDLDSIGSITTDFGTEFMSSIPSLDVFEIPSFDVASLGGFDVAGSFAGSASWFDTFNPGSILSSVPGVSDVSLSTITKSIPLNSILGSATGVSDINLSTIAKSLPLNSILSSATGISESNIAAITKSIPLNSILGSATGVSDVSLSTIAKSIPLSSIKTAAGAIGLPTSLGGIGGSITNLVSNPAALLAPSPTTGATTNLVTLAAREVDQFGLGILTDAESTQLTKKATLINSFTDASLPTTQTYNRAIESQQDLLTNIDEINTSIRENNGVISDSTKNIQDITENLLDPDLSDAQRATLQAQIEANQATIAEATANNVINNKALTETTAQLSVDQQIITQTNSSTVNSPANVDTGTSNQYAFVKDTNGTYTIIDTANGDTVQTGLTEQDAILAEQNLNINTLGITATNNTTAEDPLAAAIAANQATNIDAIGPTEADVIAALNGQTTALTNQAREQQSVRDLRNNKGQSTDWRVRLKLAPNSTYLYNDAQPGILSALKLTDGVIFPYTPTIETAYKANYDAYDLTHSNYRGYFYKGSHVDAINVRGTFTAQDTKEADYLLAVIHFFRSVTKMFYGKDPQRGSPPPLVYLNGYGDFQFSEHPCVVSQFNYNLPPDVDYIRAQSNLQSNTNQLNNRLRNPIANNPLAYSVNRLLNSSLLPGALDFRPSLSNNLATGNPTYVPTKMDISITLLPVQSRSQISNNFSVQGFANGNLLKGGFW